ATAPARRAASAEPGPRDRSVRAIAGRAAGAPAATGMIGILQTGPTWPRPSGNLVSARLLQGQGDRGGYIMRGFSADLHESREFRVSTGMTGHGATVEYYLEWFGSGNRVAAAKRYGNWSARNRSTPFSFVSCLFWLF